MLVDLEPKAVNAAQHSALAGSGGAWQFSRVAALTRAPGAANNWAAGALVHAPTVRDGVLGMLRRQAERCDRLAGVLVMQVGTLLVGGGREGGSLMLGAGRVWAAACVPWCAAQTLSRCTLCDFPHACRSSTPSPIAQSAAGGTGSGLGSALTEALRDEMPAAPLLHHCIW